MNIVHNNNLPHKPCRCSAERQNVSAGTKAASIIIIITVANKIKPLNPSSAFGTDKLRRLAPSLLISEI